MPRGDMIELWKHLHACDSSTLSHHFQPHDRTSRIHNYQFICNKPKDGLRGLQANSFYYCIINMWNHLPKDVVSAKDIDSFKTRLDIAWTNTCTQMRAHAHACTCTRMRTGTGTGAHTHRRTQTKYTSTCMHAYIYI